MYVYVYVYCTYIYAVCSRGDVTCDTVGFGGWYFLNADPRRASHELCVARLTGRAAGTYKFSKVSSLLNFLYTIVVELTFENVVAMNCVLLTARACYRHIEIPF